MKINEKTVLRGQKVILVPYKEFHVDKYHEWMLDDKLRAETASEKLSIEEERAMQRSWREDEDKCTFIVLDRETYDGLDDDNEESRQVASMIGDVNLFFLRDDDEEDPDVEPSKIAELELMIADERFRGQRRGFEAATIMLRYGTDVLKIQRYRAKIGEDNVPSRRLFAKLGFKETAFSSVFHEVTMKLAATTELIADYESRVIGGKSVQVSS